MIFGVDDIGITGWLGILGLIGTALLAITGFIIAYFNNATRLMKRVDELTTKVFQLQDESAACRQREADLKAELIRQNHRINDLEKASGADVGLLNITGIVIADLDGIIQEYSPALTPILLWLPEEVNGKHVTMLVPPENRTEHERAFRIAADNPESIDSTRTIITYALNKLNERVPVTIHHHGRRLGNGQGLITATIRQRAHARMIMSDPDVPQPE